MVGSLSKVMMRDPEAYMSHLPQPFRRVDEILADIIANALRDAEQREREKNKECIRSDDDDGLQGSGGGEVNKEAMTCKALADAVGRALMLAEERMNGKANETAAATTRDEEQDGLENNDLEATKIGRSSTSRGGRDDSEDCTGVMEADARDGTNGCTEQSQLESTTATDAAADATAKKQTKLVDIGALLTYLPPLPLETVVEEDNAGVRGGKYGATRTRGALMSWKELTASEGNFMYTL